MYKLLPVITDETTGVTLPSHHVVRLSDGVMIPKDESNADYQTYVRWLEGYELQITAPMKMEWVKTSEGNTPLPAEQ